MGEKMRNLCLLMLVAATSPLGCGSIDCITIGQIHIAEYTMKDGTSHSEEVLIGDGGSELGRCGWSWYSTGWTQDCLNHDMCQKYTTDNDVCELPGGLGPNCHGEFIKAIDDQFFSYSECGGS